MKIAGLDRSLKNARDALLAERNAEGHWRGKLSSSALSTATAVQALYLADHDGNEKLILGGLRWLVINQNPDGGWGDTTKSFSNLSTTLLAWSVLGFVGRSAMDSARLQEAERSAQEWIKTTVGSLDPDRIADAASARYGKDRTFSAPILMMCAIAGKLGHGPRAWRRVPALPFEIAALPRSVFGILRLPVVSYALPALIAIGFARFHHLPPLVPIRLLRKKSWPRASQVLLQVQPPNGGFLEATPLTSFVTMALSASGQKSHPVVAKAVDFLRESVNEDGSWAIDTDLSTWVTTLSVKALGANTTGANQAVIKDSHKIITWLLSQQYQQVHPYTNAPAGGWAWTNLPGGVPDADDSAGALLALSMLGGKTPNDRVIQSVEKGILWLLQLQNRDGGVPTFCRGWGAMPFDRSSPDITSHCLRAWDEWHDFIDPVIASRLEMATERAISYLRRKQLFEGAWSPLWFGNQHLTQENNLTYGTSQVVTALFELSKRNKGMAAGILERGIQWLEGTQNADGGWGGGGATSPSSIEETALATDSLLAADGSRQVTARGIQWLISATSGGRRFSPTPIGFYFAKLWYHERLYPLIWTVSALTKAQRACWKTPSS
ncbi:MAG: prenyltransferase/squalene oxidase repeat-containing protein [Verrucomicrobiales bacterium]